MFLSYFTTLQVLKISRQVYVPIFLEKKKNEGMSSESVLKLP
jgi:hypothetical protein